MCTKLSDWDGTNIIQDMWVYRSRFPVIELSQKNSNTADGRS